MAEQDRDLRELIGHVQILTRELRDYFEGRTDKPDMALKLRNIYSDLQRLKR